MRSSPGSGSCVKEQARARPLAGSEEAVRAAAARRADVDAAELRDHAAARRALQEAELEQVRLVDVLDRVGLLPERDRERREPDGAAAELVRDGRQKLPVGPLEPDAVDLVELERLARDVEGDDPRV